MRFESGGPDMSLVASLQRVDASLARPSDFGETQVDSDESAEPFQIRSDFPSQIYSEHHSLFLKGLVEVQKINLR